MLSQYKQLFGRLFSYILIILFFAIWFDLPAQALNGEPVEWEEFSGKDRELIVFLPKGSIATSDESYTMSGASVRKATRRARLINDCVLIFEHYEGSAKDIQKAISRREDLPSPSMTSENGFEVFSFSLQKKNYYYKAQHYVAKNRLYVVKAMSMNESDEIAITFLESVKTGISDLSQTSRSVDSLPKLQERKKTLLPDSLPVDESDVDRDLVVLKSYRPRFPRPQLDMSGTAIVKVRVLYSSSGKVTTVQEIEAPSREFADAAIQAARRSVFIPAQKDGKLVSVYKTLDYSYTVF